VTTKRPASVSLATVTIDPASAVPLYRQLYHALRAAILAQRLPGGARLPSTRALAATFHVSRHTVLTAVEQLVAEGYLEGRHGAGTYIAHVLPERYVPARVLPP
jgi:GntR family transcriptional regulator/MocR family aminotransferase